MSVFIILQSIAPVGLRIKNDFMMNQEEVNREGGEWPVSILSVPQCAFKHILLIIMNRIETRGRAEYLWGKVLICLFPG